MTSKESKTKMIANSEGKGTLARTMIRLTTAVGLAATAGMILSAAGASVRLVGVTRQGDTVLIEATEPVAYSVSRPDPLSLVVDMRNVTVADARADVAGQGAIAGVRLEQTSSDDGRALARVHVTLAKPTEYVVRSARNTIRVELKGAPGAVAPVDPPKPAPLPMPHPAGSSRAASPAGPSAPRVPAIAAPPQPAVPAKSLEESSSPARCRRRSSSSIKSSKSASATTVTLVGNGHLAPTGVTESKDRPRRLVLDFPNVTSKAPTQTAIDSPFVTRVRVALNSHQPLVTRVVMEIAGSTSYHVERSGRRGRDLAVVFEQAKSGQHGDAAAGRGSPNEPVEPEPPITLRAGDRQRCRDHEAGAGRGAHRSDLGAQNRWREDRTGRGTRGRTSPCPHVGTAAVAFGRVDCSGCRTTAPVGAAVGGPRARAGDCSRHRRQHVRRPFFKREHRARPRNRNRPHPRRRSRARPVLPTNRGSTRAIR